MEIFLKILCALVIAILGSYIAIQVGVFISLKIYDFQNRQEEENLRRFLEKIGEMMKPNIDFIDELNSESNIQADIQRLREEIPKQKQNERN